ncbi:FAD binding domain-containing protein, partial [Mycobacterium tuberculosis]|nr:FAD binding domain-containing protein [Mycobacterium tuberculosis]
QRLAAPSDLVDVTRIAELSGIQVVGDSLVIGAGTTHYDVARSATVANAIPALARLAAGIGDPAVRYKGTIGGSVANDDPAADYPAAVLALGAVIAVICWQNIPFYMMLFLAGLASFPAELAEAANLDGASEARIFWRLKLPHLAGTLRTGALLAIIGSLRYFDLIYVMTGGGPEGASDLMATYMVRTVFAL